METVDIAAVVVTRDSESWIDGTLESLDSELSAWPGAPRLVVDSDSRDSTPARVRSRGWRLVRLDPSGAVTPAAAREAGRHLVSAPRILYVDGDVKLEPGYVARAMRLLDSEPGLAGVGGRLRFDEGQGPPPPDGAPDADAPMLAALAMYRSEALERAGGFVPWLESEEDADLGLRLRRAGGRLRVIHPGGIHRSGPRHSFAETARRFRAGLYFGQGRALRLRWGGPLFAETLARQGLYLGIVALWLFSAAACPWWPGAWRLGVLGCGALWLAVSMRKRSLLLGAVSLWTWHVMAVGLVIGLLTEPRSRNYRLSALEGRA